MNHQLDHANSSFDCRLNAVALMAHQKSSAARFDLANKSMQRLEGTEQLKSAQEAVPNNEVLKGRRVSWSVAGSLAAVTLILCIGMAFAHSLGDRPGTHGPLRQDATGNAPIREPLPSVSYTPSMPLFNTPSQEVVSDTGAATDTLSGKPGQPLKSKMASRRASSDLAISKRATVTVGSVRPIPVESESEEAAEVLNEPLETAPDDKEADQTIAVGEHAPSTEPEDDLTVAAPEPPKKRSRFFSAVVKIFRRNRAKGVEERTVGQRTSER